jgi:hypothetical protein
MIFLISILTFVVAQTNCPAIGLVCPAVVPTCTADQTISRVDKNGCPQCPACVDSMTACPPPPACILSLPRCAADEEVSTVNDKGCTVCAYCTLFLALSSSSLQIQTFLVSFVCFAGKPKKSTCPEPPVCIALQPNCSENEEVSRVDDNGCQGAKLHFFCAMLKTILCCLVCAFCTSSSSSCRILCKFRPFLFVLLCFLQANQRNQLAPNHRSVSRCNRTALRTKK